MTIFAAFDKESWHLVGTVFAGTIKNGRSKVDLNLSYVSPFPNEPSAFYEVLENPMKLNYQFIGKYCYDSENML